MHFLETALTHSFGPKRADEMEKIYPHRGKKKRPLSLLLPLFLSLESPGQRNKFGNLFRLSFFPKSGTEILFLVIVHAEKKAVLRFF